MNKQESKYFHTAELMNEALLALLSKKDFSYITIKEICEKAGVNRSTFYLHYRNTTDLLEETIVNMNNKFKERFSSTTFKDVDSISFTDKENLYFIKEEYLVPYLKFIKDNSQLFILVNEKFETMHVSKTYQKLFLNVIEPIMNRFGVQEKERKYLSAYYVNGVMAIIKEWANLNYADDILWIAGLIEKIIMNNIKHQ